MKDRKIICMYLMGTFGITYLAWGIIILANQVGYLKIGTLGFWPFFAIGGLSSTFMGSIIAIKTKKDNNALSVIKTTFSIKQPIKYYGIIFMFFILFFAIPSRFDKWYIGFIYIFYMIFSGGLEEVGWRYIFQPSLEKHLPYWLASAITAILWAIWHLPLFFIDGMNKGSSFSHFVINILALAFVLGAIYRISDSLWLCVLFHAMINAFSQVWEPITYASNELISSLIAAFIKISISIILVYFVDNRKLMKQEK